MSLMHTQRLKLLLPTVLEDTHLIENTLFEHWPENVVQYPPHYVTHASAQFEVATSNIK